MGPAGKVFFKTQPPDKNKVQQQHKLLKAYVDYACASFTARLAALYKPGQVFTVTETQHSGRDLVIVRGIITATQQSQPYKVGWSVVFKVMDEKMIPYIVDLAVDGISQTMLHKQLFVREAASGPESLLAALTTATDSCKKSMR